MVVSTPLAFEPSSFRDPSSGVVLDGDRVLRYAVGEAGPALAGVLAAPWFSALIAEEKVERTTPLAREDAPGLYRALPGITAAFEHPRLPFISYPYEWSFEMLRAAALLQLELVEASFANGHMVKDATSYNVQFRGARPTFIDFGSFEPYAAGEGWRAYGQFCRLFLNPLYLQAYGGVPFQPWLRSAIDGLDTEVVRRLLPLRAKLRPSVFVDVVLQSMLTRRFAANEQALRSARERAIPDTAVRGMVSRARKTVEKLPRRKRRSAWSGYEDDRAHYSPAAVAFRERFVAEVVDRARPSMLWDLGCNTGRFSLLAAKTAQHVVAIDGDEASIDLLFERAREAAPNVHPLVMDLLNPSPNQGWAQAERQGLAERGPADVVLALALVHHIAISGNVPLPRFAAWLASVGRSAIVEFVPKADPMVQRLLLTRKDVYGGYTIEAFESALAEHWIIAERAAVPDTSRVLYHLERHG